MGVKEILNYIVVDFGGTKTGLGTINGTVDNHGKNIASDDVSCLEGAVSRYLKLSTSQIQKPMRDCSGCCRPIDKDFADFTNMDGLSIIS